MKGTGLYWIHLCSEPGTYSRCSRGGREGHHSAEVLELAPRPWGSLGQKPPEHRGERALGGFVLKLRTPFLLTGTYKLQKCELSVKIFRRC